METTFRTIFFMCGIIILAAFSCKKESTSSTNGHFGEAFSIKVNEVTSLVSLGSDTKNIDSSLTIRFKKVLYDWRCPKVSCNQCYGSTASIQVFLAHMKDTATISLTILGCRDEYDCDENLFYRKDTLGYRICLLRLDPYPTGNTINNQLIYTAKLKISNL